MTIVVFLHWLVLRLRGFSILEIEQEPPVCLYLKHAQLALVFITKLGSIVDCMAGSD